MRSNIARFRERSGASTPSRQVRATTTPTPGTVISLRQTGSRRGQLLAESIASWKSAWRTRNIGLVTASRMGICPQRVPIPSPRTLAGYDTGPAALVLGDRRTEFPDVRVWPAPLTATGRAAGPLRFCAFQHGLAETIRERRTDVDAARHCGRSYPACSARPFDATVSAGRSRRTQHAARHKARTRLAPSEPYALEWRTVLFSR